MQLSELRIIAVAFAVVGLSGCAFRPAVTRMAVDYNQFVASATNKQTAINILRARDREPRHFTSFTNVIGTADIEASSSLGADIGLPADVRSTDAMGAVSTTRTVGGSTVSPSLDVKISSGTHFEIAINATDDFWKGILSSVPQSMAVYYLRQGWAADMMSYLLIEDIAYSVVLTDADGHLVDAKGEAIATSDKAPIEGALFRLSNSPNKKDDMDDFAAAIRCRQLSYVPIPESKKALPVADIADLANVSKDVLADVRIVQSEKDKYQHHNAVYDEEEAASRLVYETTEAERFGLALSARTPQQCSHIDAKLKEAIRSAIPDELKPKATGSTVTVDPALLVLTPPSTALSGKIFSDSDNRLPRATSQVVAGVRFKSEGFCNNFVQRKYRCSIDVLMTMRSPEGIIYYLGETLRKHAERPLLYGDCPDEVHKGYCIPLIVISDKPLAPGVARFTDVDFKGVHYVLPSTGETVNQIAGRTSEVITFVEQLLNLYRSSKDFPSTPFVKVIN